MAFVNKKQKIELPSGEAIEVPRLTIGRILAVTNHIAELVKAAKQEVPELLDMEAAGKDPSIFGARILQAIPEILPKVSDHIVSIVASYINKEEDWVRENLDLEDVAAIATPFFANILHQGNHILGVVNKAMSQDPSDKSAKTSKEVPQS